MLVPTVDRAERRGNNGAMMDKNATFPLPDADHDIQELGSELRPLFDDSGLVTAVVTDHATGEVVMLAHMNAEALAATISTGIATYWSRSRRKIWIKGETSGNRQHVKDLRVDCDQDAVWLAVETEGLGAACHQGFRSCFYRRIPLGDPQSVRLERVEAAPLFDPDEVYVKP
jgi:phosphoribosyl-AMP cyclohydrolase